jgi:hypothetical protein
MTVVIMPWVDDGIIAKRIYLLVNRVVQVGRTPLLKVGSATPSNKERIASEGQPLAVIVDDECKAA